IFLSSVASQWMKTPTMMHRSSTCASEITPSRTESTTARATPACAGPNIWTAWVAPLIVTLLAMRVSGFAGRFGATTARRFVCPSFWFSRAAANAWPTGPSFEPIMRSMWATSFPSPTRDSPTMKEPAIRASPLWSVFARPRGHFRWPGEPIVRRGKLYDGENGGQGGASGLDAFRRGIALEPGGGRRRRATRVRARGKRREAGQHHAPPRLRGHVLRRHGPQRDRDRTRARARVGARRGGDRARGRRGYAARRRREHEPRHRAAPRAAREGRARRRGRRRRTGRADGRRRPRRVRGDPPGRGGRPRRARRARRPRGARDRAVRGDGRRRRARLGRSRVRHRVRDHVRPRAARARSRARGGAAAAGRGRRAVPRAARGGAGHAHRPQARPRRGGARVARGGGGAADRRRADRHGPRRGRGPRRRAAARRQRAQPRHDGGPRHRGAGRCGPRGPSVILLVSVSARMLAALAVRDGHEVVAVDRFGDLDLRRLCQSVSILRDLGGRGGMAELVAAADAIPAGRVVYGAGLENRPDLVARLAAGRTLLGCEPATRRRGRDPALLGASLCGAGLAYPATFSPATAPALAERARRWLRKPLRGGGGRGVREWRGGRLAGDVVVQERIRGLACSAAAVADGGAAT